MMTLKKVTIHKYKSIEEDQAFIVDDQVTVLVGMNESGKTSVLEAVAKSNYFTDDDRFKFNDTHDYPRREKKKMSKSGKVPAAITLEYELSKGLLDEISEDVGKGVFSSKSITRQISYQNKGSFLDLNVNLKKFVDLKTNELSISSNTLNSKLYPVSDVTDLQAVKSEYKDEGVLVGLDSLTDYYQNEWKWKDPISEYIARVYLKPNIPKFLYYDEFYSLPSRISIEALQADKLEDDELKTAKALFELADIDIDELINADDYEDFKAELEATEASITDELFEFWSTNKNLEIEFDIDSVEKTDSSNNRRIVEHVLDIRVKNSRTRVSLPLKNRSKGFNWFFSFLVWFKKIQEDSSNNYILLLDEPGLNLHASAQSDLLNFIENLSEEYQIIYTTHSPFMVEPSSLHRVRTVVETDSGSMISDSIQEKDPKTLFPLQAALGYDIAQNLFISKRNLLVEGVSDLVYLQVMSSILEELGRTTIRDDITIVPVGGMEKVSTFVSLMRGSKLDIACLLDSSIDASSKSKLDNLVREKVIHQNKVRFFDEFLTGYTEADIEDVFTLSDYIKLFNQAFSEHKDLCVGDLDTSIGRVILKINKALGVKRFNHYRPANVLARSGLDTSNFEKDTLDNFEVLTQGINSLFD